MESNIVADLDAGLHLDRAGYSRFPSKIELVFFYDIRDGLGLRRILQVDSVLHFAFSRSYDEHDTDPDWQNYADLLIGVEMSEATETELFEENVYYCKSVPEMGKKRCHLRLHFSKATLDIVTVSQACFRWV